MITNYYLISNHFTKRFSTRPCLCYFAATAATLGFTAALINSFYVDPKKNWTETTANMKTVELQNEDIPHDMICYADADGHTYDFGFGMNWKGEIHDARISKYVNHQ